MYELYGKQYTMEALQDSARKQNIPFEDFMGVMFDRGLKKAPMQAPEDKGFIEDIVDVYNQSVATAGTVDEAFDLYKQGADISDEQLQAVIDARDKMQEFGPTNEQFEFAKSQKANGGGISGTLLALYENPGFIPQFLVGSAVTMAGSLQSEEVAGTTALSAGVGAATGAGIGLAGGIFAPITSSAGAITGTISGGMGGLVGSMETGLTLMDLLQDEVGQGTKLTKDNIREVLNDTEKFEKIKERAVARGRNIGAIEALAFGLSRGVGSQLTRVGKFRRAGVASTAIETGGGFTGEVAGQIGAEQEIDLGEATLEAIGEVVSVEQAVNLNEIVKGTLQKSEYYIGTEKRSKKEIVDLLNSNNLTNEEKAKIKFDVKNDKQFENFVDQKQADATLETQIDPKVGDLADRKKLVDLEKQRAKAEADTKKKGIFKVFDSQQKLEKVEEQINQIMNKYTTVDGRTKDVRARAKTAKEVRLARQQMLMDKITQRVSESRTYKNMDIETREVETEQEARELFEQDVNKEILVLEEELKNPDLDPQERANIRKQLNAAKAAIKDIGSKTSEAGLSHGFLLEDAQTGKMTIVINKERALADSGGNINVAAHEFLHAVLKRTFGDQSALQPAANLVDFLNQNKQFLGTRFSQRLLSYDAGEQRAQEVFTVLSDSILEGDITYNEGFFARLGGFISDFLTAYVPGRKIKFKDGRDAFRFIKNYNKSIQGDRISSRLVQKAQQEGIEFETTEPTETTQRPLSKEASDNVQQLYENRTDNASFEFDIIEQFKPIVSRIVDKRKDAPNFDRQLLTDEIETGQRGILDLIREYKPDSGVPLAAYINKFLPARAIEASRRVLGEEFTQDVTEARGVAAEEVTTEVETKRPTKKIVLAERLGITEQVEKAISKIIPNLNFNTLTFKNLKNKIPNITGDLFGIAPKKIVSLANLTKKELQSSQMFINKNADLLIAMLPEGATTGGTATGIPNSLLKAFYTKTDRAKAADTGSKAGLAIQEKRDITKEEFLETFGIVDGKPNRDDRNTSARVLALANLLGKVITNQAVRQLVKQENLRSLEDGVSVRMFSKEDKVIAEENGQGDTYYEINDLNSVGRYIEQDVPRIVKVFEEYPGLISGNELVNGLNAIKIDALKQPLRNGVKGITKRGDYPKRDFAKFVGKTVVEMDTAKINEFNRQAEINFDAHWTAIDKALSKDPTLLGPLLIYLSNSVNSKTHIHRGGATMTAYDKTVKGKLYLEHALQNVAAYRFLIRESMKDKSKSRKGFKKAFKALKKNYKLIGVSKPDNGKLDAGIYIDENGKKVSFKNGMGKGWNVFDNNWWERYFNEIINALGGINPENFVVINSKNNLAQEFNIPILQPEIKSRRQFSKAVNTGRVIKDPKGITILDFDDTLATTKSLVRYIAPDGSTGTLNAEQYASTYQELLEQGYTFDFSEFNKVVKGKIAPLFQKALKLQGKFGPENMFVLTARPPESAKAIFDFLKANGLNIPLKNISGLANSTSEAKALWVAEKVGEGFNDFYFADDALQNVQAVKNMLNQFDVKSKVQQARTQFSKPENLDKSFNDILQEVTGIESKKRFSDIKARKRGAGKGKFRFFIPPSHEDFIGLLYNFMGKGKKGNAHRDFFEQALVKPLNRAYREIDTAKQAIANDYKALNKQMSNVKDMLAKKTPDGDFTYQDAIRVYIWDKHGYTIPGLTETDQKSLVDIVKKDPDLQVYAEAINTISKQDAYVDPGPNWETGNIRIDLVDATGRVGRKTYFAEFQENADIIFSPENLNKIEAAYGKNLKEALEDMLYRTKTGINRPKGSSAKPNMLMNWLNASVSGVMFFNTRSALLQQMSNVNYLNFADNNILAAGKAFANQKQYWTDFAMIFNSDMLKQRRGGLQTDINGAELAEAIKKARPGNLFDQVAIIIGKALRLGFLPTQIGDNIAIATGGATFYRNRVNKYVKDGFPIDVAEKKAFTDFQNITQSTQQSARPDMTSAQQAAAIGKLVLNFLNTPSQYNRIIKKAGSDIINRRITPPNTTLLQSDMSNMSRILYYGAAQNLIFYSLQTALFAVMFGLDDEDEDKKAAEFLKKKERVINGSIDTILRGSGIYGVAVSTLKNMAIKFLEQRAKGYNKDEAAVVMELLNFSPVVGIKARRIVNAEKTLNYNMKVIQEMETFDIDNPMWSAVTNYTQTITTAPTNKIYQKVINLRNAADSDYTLLQRILFFSGYTTWSLNLGDTKKMEKIKEDVKKKKEAEAKKKRKKKTKSKTGPKKLGPKQF